MGLNELGRSCEAGDSNAPKAGESSSDRHSLAPDRTFGADAPGRAANVGSWLDLTQPPGKDEKLPGPVWGRVDSSMGVLAGEHNLQKNTYRHKLDQADVDLSKALRRPRVSEALARLRAHPQDKKLREEADQALASGTLFSSAHDIRVHHPSVESRSGERTFWNCLVIENSEGVLLGDDSKQENLFVLATTASMNGGRLLREDGDFREALISSICDLEPRANDDAQAALREAFEDAVLGSPNAKLHGSQFRSSPWLFRVAIEDELGVCIGRSSAQLNEAEVTLENGPHLQGLIGEEKELYGTYVFGSSDVKSRPFEVDEPIGPGQGCIAASEQEREAEPEDIWDDDR